MRIKGTIFRFDLCSRKSKEKQKQKHKTKKEKKTKQNITFVLLGN